MYQNIYENKFVERMDDAEFCNERNARLLFRHLEKVHDGMYVLDIGELRELFEETTFDEVRRAHPAEYSSLSDEEVVIALVKRVTVIGAVEPILIQRF